MSNIVKVSLRISGRDLTLACPENEKDQLIKSAKLLNAELENIKDKNNALIIAGLGLANKVLTGKSSSESSISSESVDLQILIDKIDSIL